MLYIHLIWRQIKIVAAHLGTIGKIAWSYIRTHVLISSIAAVVLVVAIGTLMYLFGGSAATETPNGDRAVTLIRVGDVSQSEPLSLIGTVRSTREALVAPDFSGTVSGVYRGIGDYVAAGTIIAELKNDSQRAAVAQAKAALDKTKSSVAVGGIGVENAENSYLTAQDSARTTIQTAYASMDDAIKRKADEAFSNPNSSVPKFNVTTSNSQLSSKVENGRLALQPILTRHSAQTTQLTDTDALLAELGRVSGEIKTTQTFLQDMVAALNAAIATNGVSETAIATFRADASAALGSINALSSTVSGSIENLKAKRAGVDAAQTSLSTGATGVSADIAGAEANLAAANAQLEKTLIRAPISGTINRLDLDVGSFVGAASPVIYITNAGGLEAVAFVSSNDIGDIAINAKATVAGTVIGSVVRVASAVDPITKKAEVRISVPQNAPLVSGQSATIEIARAVRKAGDTTITIPLSAIKITPEGPVVFSVTASSTLALHPVALGTLHGSKVEIASGLTVEDRIVEDARGLKDGETVEVKTP